MTTDRLLPCPHCGEAEHLYPSYRNMGAGKPYAIDCLGCGADYVPRDGMDVIAMWNRRSPAPSASMGRVTVDDLAQIIRRVDGKHSLGAGELAERILAALDPPPDHGGGEGWVMVPREPTMAMMAAGADRVDDSMAHASAVYRAMLASLPTQESEDGR